MMTGSSMRFDLGGVGPAGRIVDFDDGAIGEGDFVADAGRGGDEVERVLALEALLNNFEVEQAEEAAAKAEAEGDGGLGLEGEAGVVEAKFFEGVAEHGVLVRVDGVEAGEDHGLDVFEAGEGFGAGALDGGDGVADLGVGYVFDGGDEEADFAGGEFGDLDGLGGHDAHGVDFEAAVVGHDLDLHALAELAVDDAGEDDDAFVGVEPAIEDEGLERSFGVALRRRKEGDDGFEDALDVEAGLGGDGDGVVGGEAYGFFDHGLGALDVGGGEIDLVDDGDDFEAVGDGEVGVGEGLGLDAL